VCRNYDEKKDYQRMVKAGVFQSVSKEGKVVGGW
jgi:hypothetical protein